MNRSAVWHRGDCGNEMVGQSAATYRVSAFSCEVRETITGLRKIISGVEGKSDARRRGYY